MCVWCGHPAVLHILKNLFHIKFLSLHLRANLLLIEIVAPIFDSVHRLKAGKASV